MRPWSGSAMGHQPSDPIDIATYVSSFRAVCGRDVAQGPSLAVSRLFARQVCSQPRVRAFADLSPEGSGLGKPGVCPTFAPTRRCEVADLARRLSWLHTCCFLWLLCAYAWAQSPQDLAAKAAQALRNKDYATAETAYKQLLAAVPNVAELHSNHGMACYFQKKFDCAQQAFSQALKLKPELFLPNFLLGQILFERDEYEAALPLVERAVQDQPAQKPLRSLYAGILIALEKYGQAVTVFEGSLEADPSDADSYYGLGQLYLEMGQKTVSKLAEDGEPNHGELNHGGLNFAQLLAAERAAPPAEVLARSDEPAVEAEKALALNAFRDALNSGVEVRGARVGYARLLIATKEWESAQLALEAELHDDPWSYEAQYQLARAALGQSDAARAAKYLEEAVQIRPEFFDPLPELHLPLNHEGLGQQLTSLNESDATDGFGATLVRSWLYAEQNNAARSREWALKAERLRDGVLARIQARIPNTADDPERAAVMGLDSLRRKRYGRGLGLLLPIARKRTPEDGVALEIARALYRTQRYKELVDLSGGHSHPELTYLIASGYRELALEQFQAMVEMDPDSARAHQVLGDAFFAQQRYLDAAREYESAVKLQPNNPELHFLRGNSYYKQMSFPTAVEAFERTIALNPRHGEAHLMLGDSLLQMGRNELAVKILKKNLDLSPDLDNAYVLLGKAYRSLGDLELALANLEKGASLDKDGSIHYQMAMLYRRLKQTDKAREALRKSQELRRKPGN